MMTPLKRGAVARALPERRQAMKPGARVILSFAAILAIVCGCSKSPQSDKAGKTPTTTKPSAGKPINVYLYSEYIDPDIPKQFEEKTGIKVNLSFYEATEDMMAKLQQAGGAEQYDVVVVSDHAIPVLARQGLIRELDLSKVPNMKNLDPRFANPSYDPGSKHSLPYQWGTMGLVYRTDRIKNIDASWGLIFDAAKQPGPFVMVDSMRDMFAAALKYQGKSINARNADDIRAAGELILQAKKSPKLLGFEGSPGAVSKVSSDEAVMGIVYNGDAFKAVKENQNVGFAVPKEGTLIWVDAMTITAKAPNPDGAYKFIDYILDAEVGAQLSNFNSYATPNAASMPKITPEDRENPMIYPPQEQVEKMEYLEDVGNDTRLYDEAWTAVKSR
jgi:spermidine/putrescine transport system substrate-binding protein